MFQLLFVVTADGHFHVAAFLNIKAFQYCRCNLTCEHLAVAPCTRKV